MNSLTAAELKRRGMAAIEEGLRRGPVHLMKHNEPSAVVVSEEHYAQLSQEFTDRYAAALRKRGIEPHVTVLSGRGHNIIFDSAAIQQLAALVAQLR